MKSNIFNMVKMDSVKGSTFNLSHKVKTSFDIGELVPTCIMEVLPGDDFKINVETLTRMAPLIAPVMHNLKINTHFFFVPNRLLWPEWEEWITGGSAVAPPTATFDDGILQSDLASHLDIREQDNQNQSVMPIAAYCLIYDEYYRAQHIQTSEKFIELVAGNGGANDAYTNSVYAGGPCFHRAWSHDYFTSALPTPQLGNAVELPLLSNDNVDVTFKASQSKGSLIRDATDDSLTTGAGQSLLSNTSGEMETTADGPVFLDPNGTLEVDITGEVTNINNLREAFALQRWLEKEMRAGTRYVEHNMAFFGVRSSDQRVNRPEYIGGASQNMVISEVLSTADVGLNLVGEMSGHGISAGAGTVFKYKSEEHGFIIGITSVLPEADYYQGIDKMFTRSDRFDYANPMFANLGEQETLQKELYVEITQSQATIDTVFGYVPRFAEYKFINNKVHGEFTASLEYWHFGRKFTSAPLLNGTFIECVTDKRQFASVTGNNTIYAIIVNNIYAYRKLPKYGIPSIVGQLCESPYTVTSKKPKWIGGKWTQTFPVDCGKCPICRITKVRQWSFRLMKEESKSFSSYFITLTYENWSVPITENGFMTLDHGYITKKGHRSDDIIRFIKKLRKADNKKWKSEGNFIYNKKKIIYYLAAEYGSKTKRPHYHLILLNLYDKESLYHAWKKKAPNGKKCSMGNIHIDQVNGNTIAYTLKYLDKTTGIPKFKNDDRLKEFSRMSNNIGEEYLTEAMINYHKSDLSRCYITSDHYKVKMPKYYADKIYNDAELKKMSKLVGEHHENEEIKLKDRVVKIYKGRMSVEQYKAAQQLHRHSISEKSKRGRNKI